MNATPSPSEFDAIGQPLKQLADQIRFQFENLQRQPELASDLNCFRPGERLFTIRFIANAESVHVARWLTLFSRTQARVQIDTVNRIPAYSTEIVSVRPLLPNWRIIPMSLRYLIGGVVMRLFRSGSSNEILHAHSASGNGLAAWLSGRRYVVGIYGSEIFDANQRGFVYRWMLKRILQGAERIADCSPECTKILREQFDIPQERIYSFHLGYDEKIFHPLNHSSQIRLRRDAGLPSDEPVWVVSRRTHPHYRTKEVVQGFLEYCQRNRLGRLVLLCGDNHPKYTETICEIIRSHADGHRVTVVNQFLSPAEFASWLQLSDFSISVPRTDNFSISILESMGCGTVPILSNLDGYGELRSCQPVRWMTEFEPVNFSTMFGDTALSWPCSQEADKNECVRYVQGRFSTERALRDIAAFYLGASVEREEPTHVNCLPGRAA